MPGKENMKKEMIINVSQQEECRVAIVEDGVLDDLYVERARQDNLAGNIYLGKVVNLFQDLLLQSLGTGRTRATRSSPFPGALSAPPHA